ncbi:MAG: amidohydrolase family protein [Pseudomonadota bacterium]
MIWLRRFTLMLAMTLGAVAVSAEVPRATLIKGARVFDGTGAPAIVEDVLIVGDRIVAVGKHLTLPRATRVIDARGLTLLPGLHDLHTHLRAPAFDAPDDLGKAYAAYLLDGVTTVNDYSLSGEMIAPIRDMTQPRSASGGIAAPNLNLAVRIGVPGGHGTEFGWGDFFTMQASTPRAAHLAMAKALAYKPDVIKVFADGWRYGRDPDLNSMNLDTLSAIVVDAHKAGIPVITHTVTLKGAKIAAAAGVDAVGHGVGDAPVDDELIALMKKNGTAYIATLATYEPEEDRTFAPAVWARLRPQERAKEEARMARPLAPIPPLESKRWAIMLDNVRRLKAAGIPVGIGTDAGIEGTYHGSSTIREIRRLTTLGYTPADALVSATSVSARIIGQGKDHGTIQAGMRADLLLTGGRPDERIADLSDVRRVWVAGREQDLVALRKLADGDAPTPMPVTVMKGPIYTGVRPDGRTDLDTLPVESTESGTDHSRLFFVRPDQATSRGIFMVARMGARSQPYAQLIVPLTPGAVTLADARGFTGVAFDARGAGSYALSFDSYGLQPDDWFRADFSAAEAMGEVRIPFSAFKGNGGALDLARLRALIVRLKGEPGGNAWLEIANLRFYR